MLPVTSPVAEVMVSVKDVLYGGDEDEGTEEEAVVSSGMVELGDDVGATDADVEICSLFATSPSTDILFLKSTFDLLFRLLITHGYPVKTIESITKAELKSVDNLSGSATQRY